MTHPSPADPCQQPIATTHAPALFAYAADQFGDEFFDEAWEEFFLWDAVPDEIDDSREFGTTFDPFFVFSFVPDAETDLPPGWPTEPLALHFLHQEVESCPDFHREFIEQACRSHPSFFAIESTDPGRSIDLKDILTGRHFRVLEQSASRTFRAGDLTLTRVVTADRRHYRQSETANAAEHRRRSD